MIKNFIIDTNVLLHDSESLRSFGNNNVIIPIIVLDELDKFKTDPGQRGANCRKVIRSLDQLRTEGKLLEGVKLENSTIKVLIDTKYENIVGMNIDKVDHRILNVCLNIKKDSPNEEVVLVTKDINLRVKCDAFDINAQDYEKDKIQADVSDLYSGFKIINVEESIISDFYAGKHIYPKDLVINDELYPNQCIILMYDDGVSKKSILCFYLSDDEPFKRITDMSSNNADIFGIKAKNKEQNFALNMLMDKKVSLVILTGLAGSGKTLLSIAAALEQIDNKVYDKVVITRPMEPLSKELGFLPGTKMEKMEPWLAPLYDNLSFCLGGDKHMIEDYIRLGKLEIEAITYMRGRSIANSIIIIDEAQNLTNHELKTILSRSGEGTKVVLTGDIQQIDNPYLDILSNGLTYVTEKFKEYKFAACITMIKGERSELATISAEIL